MGNRQTHQPTIEEVPRSQSKEILQITRKPPTKPLEQTYDGDIVFTDFKFDIQTLSTGLSEKLHSSAILIQHFTPNFDIPGTPFQKQNHPVSWHTVLMNEPITVGHMGHFEVLFGDKINSSMIGAICGSNEYVHDFYLGGSNRTGKGLMLSSRSLYDKKLHAAGEFNHVELKPGDSVGIFIDFRNKENGIIFFTHNGKLIGPMFEHLSEPIYPGVSVSNCTLEDAKRTIQIADCLLPQDWDNEEKRKFDYEALNARYREFH